ncbi:hypothetical protein M3661_28910 [Paenibacillus sp. MER 180]|uniref:hypothetical protein n=1 Tax=Paenibacillus sp. MER 180 TaxID=2939570 RepID=UPI00203AB6DD|nr:hypothetical protein [Paenibacillus sp. MER 180]MCM3294121.1 hypothetical protein [Paenibacillus sp. MER 180]
MYRDELDALNAIYKEQKRTNELLEQLLQLQKGGESEDAPKGRSGRNTGKGTKQLPVTQVDSKEDNSGT